MKAASRLPGGFTKRRLCVSNREGRGVADMAEDRNQIEPEEHDPDREAPAKDDDDEMLLFVLANALVPIFFRRRR